MSILDVAELATAEAKLGGRIVDLVEIGLNVEECLGLAGWRGVLPRLAEIARDLEAVPC